MLHQHPRTAPGGKAVAVVVVCNLFIFIKQFSGDSLFGIPSPFYASPSSGDAYSDRPLTLNFEF